MKLIYKIKRGGLIGSVYEEKIGYTYKIKGKINNKYAEVARSYCYFNNKELAIEHMELDFDNLINITPLFNINDFKKGK